MFRPELPPGQHEQDTIPRWNIDRPGIQPTNPTIDLEKWILTIDGKIENLSTLTWRQLSALPAVESKSDFHCVEGWSVMDCRWYGVKFSILLELVKPMDDARYVTFRCSDGYTTSLDLDDLVGDGILLAYRLNDKPLEISLGGPLRLIVPSKYAYKSAMWVERVTFTSIKELGFWEKRGYSDTADVWRNDRFAR